MPCLARSLAAVTANHNLFVPSTASNPLHDPSIPTRVKTERYHPVHMFPSFAEGTLFTSSVMEALLAQAYQNPFMIPFTKRMIHSDQLQLEELDPSLYVCGSSRSAVVAGARSCSHAPHSQGASA